LYSGQFIPPRGYICTLSTLYENHTLHYLKIDMLGCRRWQKLSVDVLSARKTGKNSSGCREQHFIGTEEASMATSTSANDLLPVYVNAVNVPTMENVQDSMLHVVLGFYIRWMTKKQLKVTNQVKKGIYISYEAHIRFL
jgi:hypothetical protein